MKSSDIIKAIKYKYSPKAAFVPELTLEDKYYTQTYMRSLPIYREYYARHGLLDPDYVADDSYDMNKGKPSRRIDLLMLHSKKWTAIEIKVSRADFFRDIEEKRRVWQEHTHRFIYATPQGLVTAEEVPEGCGLWEVTPRGQVIITKKSRVNKERKEFPESFLSTLFWRLATVKSKSRF